MHFTVYEKRVTTIRVFLIQNSLSNEQTFSGRRFQPPYEKYVGRKPHSEHLKPKKGVCFLTLKRPQSDIFHLTREILLVWGRFLNNITEAKYEY